MDLDVFAPQELGTAFAVLRTALNPSGTLDARERAFLETYARIVGSPEGWAIPAPVKLAEVSITGEHPRKRLVQLAAIAALLSRPLRPDAVAFVRALSRHLVVNDSVVDVLESLVRGKCLRARLLTMRRGMRVLLGEAHRAEGVRGVLRIIGAMLLKVPVNRDMFWSYKRLGLLPEGTLGREYWKQLTRLGFGFPGEPGGIPASVSYHDVGHVLTGYDTSPMGEIQEGAFQAGNRREDGFVFLQFVILQFHHGVKLARDAEPQVGNFDPARVLWAVHRGARCKVDMTHQWNYWPLMPLSLEKAREECGIIPPLGAAA